ncbi:MAG: inositol monophosphatase family protein [Candidatus Coproplasma sp.]
MNYNAIIELVYEARKIALDKKLRSDVSLKGKSDYVTKADLEISDFVKTQLKRIAPETAFVTEEESEHSNADDRFILDPIDGTTNIVRGYNLSSISLAHYSHGKVKFGVVYSIFGEEMFFALEGKGAYRLDTRGGIKHLLKYGVENYCNNPIKVSDVLPENAICEFGAGSTNKASANQTFALAQKIFKDCADLRRICSTALSICFIAAGRIDGYFERRIKPWDYAAAALILSEAGGKISQWDGQALPFDGPSSIVAANPAVYDYLVKALNSDDKG